jgi:DtxR family Mn-dependent transcriptional regulator
MGQGYSRAMQDYLKAIYEVGVNQGRVTTNQIATALAVKPASVTGMFQKLAKIEPPLIEYEKHQGVKLTKSGERVALRIIRRHRLIEMFLHETLGFSWDEVDQEAEQLEHVVSEEIVNRMAHALGNPTHDPHGSPIPDENLSLPASSQLRLSELRTGQQARVQRVLDDDPELLRYLSELGMRPGAELTILEHSSFDDNLRLQIEHQPAPVVLGKRVTNQVFVDLH